MKNSIFALIGIIFVIAMSGCNKDEQPRFVKVDILTNTGNKIVAMEDYIDKNRATADPTKYDSLANYCTNEVLKVLMNELKPDSFKSNRGDIANVIGKYDEFWRDKHPKHKSKVWKRLDVGVSEDAYRVCDAYSEKLLTMLKGYCDGTVNGNANWVPGERDNAIELKIQKLFVFDPDEDPTMFWQYRDRLHEYFKKFAENPNNKAKKKRDGFMNFGWWQ